MLLGAEQVADAANLHVFFCQQVPAAEVVEFSQGVQAALRLFGQAARIEQIRPRLSGAPPDPPSELIELRQTEFVGAFDHEGVCPGYVQTRFDDGRRQQDVVRTLGKVEHNLLELIPTHLPVRHPNPRFRNDPL